MSREILENTALIDRPSQKVILKALTTFNIPLEYASLELRHNSAVEFGSPLREVAFRFDSDTGQPVVRWRDKGTLNSITIEAANLEELKYGSILACVFQVTNEFDIKQAEIAVTTFRRRDDGGSGTLGGDYMDLGVIISPHSIWVQNGRGTEEQKKALADWIGNLQHNL